MPVVEVVIVVVVVVETDVVTLVEVVVDVVVRVVDRVCISWRVSQGWSHPRSDQLLTTVVAVTPRQLQTEEILSAGFRDRIFS